LYFNVNNFVPTISDCHYIIEWSMSAKFTIDIIADEVKLYYKSSKTIWMFYGRFALLYSKQK
jgi:hypothetical protein